MPCHNLNGYTGKKLQNYLVKLVEDDVNDGYWDEDRSHYFQFIDDFKSVKTPFVIWGGAQTVFRINCHPTNAQPGNGLVEFPNFHRTSYDYLMENCLKNQDFQGKRRNYLESRLTRASFTNPEIVPNILLSFEIARRVQTDKYPITKQQTEQAIHFVMNIEENYVHMISKLVEMLQGKKELRRKYCENRGIFYVKYKDYDSRRKAYEAIISEEEAQALSYTFQPNIY